MAPEPREKPFGPAARVEVLDALRHGLEPTLALARRQLEGVVEVLDDPVDVPRVDEQRAGKHLRGSRELGEEQRTAPATRQARLRLTDDELVGDEVHPVAKGGDHHHVRTPVEGHERRLREVAVDVLDGRRPGLTEAAVDACDQELDLVALRPELGALETGGNEHLGHGGRPCARRILLEEPLVRLELLRDPLRVVEPLDTEDQPAPVVLAVEIGEQTCGLGVRERLAKALDVDADRIDADPDPSPVDLQPVRLGVDAEDAEARRAEVAGVVTDLEAHVVGSEHAAQELLPRREQSVHLRRRERRVQEESDREPWVALPQHRGDEHEVEVVDPHTALGTAVRDDRVGEALVDLDVALPRLGSDPQPVREVVEERPERVVADLPVEVVLLVARQVHGVQVVPRQALADTPLEPRGDDRPGPSDPRRVAPDGLQCGRKAARAARDLDVLS